MFLRYILFRPLNSAKDAKTMTNSAQDCCAGSHEDTGIDPNVTAYNVAKTYVLGLARRLPPGNFPDLENALTRYVIALGETFDPFNRDAFTSAMNELQKSFNDSKEKLDDVLTVMFNLLVGTYHPMAHKAMSGAFLSEVSESVK